MTESTIIRDRLSALREAMAKDGIDYYLIPTSDYHNSEYVAPYFQLRAHFSCFTGSAGTLLVKKDGWAGLWTDGRYYVQAAAQIKDTGITLYRMSDEGVPTIREYLEKEMEEGETLGFDGMTLDAGTGRELTDALKEKNIRFAFDKDIAGTLWTERPALPCHEVYVLSDDITGKSFGEKCAEVREAMKKEHCAIHVLSKLDDIMWLTNLRGNDVQCNPVALSYLVLTDKECRLFIQEAELTESVRAYLKENDITIDDYHNIVNYLEGMHCGTNILADRRNLSHRIWTLLKEKSRAAGKKLIDRMNETTKLKAVKNGTELSHIREVYLKDSAVLTEFLYYVKTRAVSDGMTEYTLSEKLDKMRAALPGFIELSFDTISAYGPNAAMMHYKAEEETAAKVEAKGFYLVDSGATYMGGTTDVTRTVVLGDITDEMKMHYTLTVMGMLRLASARFLSGCAGRNLDVLARGPAWSAGIDYKCGTGHGIGYMLNVHEGPHSIRHRHPASMGDEVDLTPGMIVSDEPGVYIEGSHGIRIENILEVVKDISNSDGQFLRFDHLTWVPIDPDAIDVRYMQPQDVDTLNVYHKAVYAKLSPLIKDDAVRDWLKEQTKELVWKAG